MSQVKKKLLIFIFGTLWSKGFLIYCNGKVLWS